MNWQLRASQGDCSSLEGYFNRLSTGKVNNLFKFTACNQTQYDLQLVLAGKPSSDSSVFIKQGWFRLLPGRCTYLGWYAQGNFLYFANYYGSTVGWYGDYWTCVDSYAFRQVLSNRECLPEKKWGFIERYVDTNTLTVTFP
jgi:uncharacterized membrane protein